MRIDRKHILITFFLFFMTTGAQLSYGQEAGAPIFDGVEPETDKERERVMYSPGESSDPPPIKSSSTVTTSNTTARKDSASIRSVSPKSLRPAQEASKNAGKGKDEDDSILSFNFLYYIIQKYKLQDIVD